ncbi:MAG: T9SS type A sorting domain-containing protein, partial [Bacteroidetes bacterium]
CCDTSCTVTASANDTTVCQGDVVILSANGCTGTMTWTMLGPDGPVFVGEGPVVDIFPQVGTTCYVVTCCCQGPILCCTTDTICITVNPHPDLQWPTVYREVCQNSDSIFLDASNILVFVNPNWVPVTSTGGTGVFSGPGVVGNYFYPTTLGLHTIIYTYTDSLGCSATIANTINVIYCCDTSCIVSAGPDITICSGNYAVLSATGCTGNVTWSLLTVEGPVVIGQGPVLDVNPTQSSCYIVTCCCPGPIVCCTTDTVCVIVRTPPRLEWPQIFDEVCLNSAPILLDPANVFVDINMTMVSVPFAGGTGYFAGLGVSGSYFYPNTLGSHVITYYYTDSAGCTGSITNTINVIFCCDSNCVVSAGPDITICSGNYAALSATGCTGSVTWSLLTVEGPVVIGQGPELDVNPTQNSCYIVTCCCPGPIVCCTTDTVCVIVNTTPRLEWPVSYATLCLNSPAITLSPGDIFVDINMTMVSVPYAGGTGYFSGPGIFGNTFVPNTLGIHTITYYYTDSAGCTGSVTNTIGVIACPCGPCYHPGISVISNGGFDLGNTGFNSDLASTCICMPFTYCIETNANRKCIDNQNVPGPSSDPQDNFLIVEGLGSGAVWRQNVTIDATETYDFSIWINPSLGTNQIDKPDLEIRVGTQVILTLAASTLSNGWTEYSTHFNGISASSIEVYQTNSSSSIFTYGIDLIALKPCIPNVVITFSSVSHVTCFGGSNGSITATGSGGTSPYSYVWSNGATTQSITNVPAGTYTVTVTDSLGCMNTRTFVILEPAKISGAATSTAALCNLLNGTATVFPSGGNAPYTYLWNNGQTGQTATGLGAGSYSVIVTDANGCTGILFVNVASSGLLPSPSGPILGPAGACRGQNGVVYYVEPVSGASSYIWTLPAGVTGSSSGSSITLNFSSTYNGGFICVAVVNPCGVSATTCFNIPVISVKPSNPGLMNGPAYPCGPGLYTYSIGSVFNALSYVWTVSGTGVAIMSGQGTNSVVVSIPAGFGQGRVSVYAENCVGISARRDFTITGLAIHGNALVGPSFVCPNSMGVNYSIAPVNGATSYAWSVSSGDMNVVSSNGPSCIVNFGPAYTTGMLTVTTTSPCGTFAKSYTLFSAPNQPGGITGPGSNLCGQNGVTYSINAVTGATSYIWSVPSGVTITNNTGLSITVNFGPGFTSSGNICVSAASACGTSIARCYNVLAAPSAPTSISGAGSVCKSSSAITYSVSPVAGATYYSWYANGGAGITPQGIGLSAIANFNGATSSNVIITARANNNCGISQPYNKPVAVNLNCRESNVASNLTDKFEVYPNPNNGVFKLEFALEQKENCSIRITDVLGNIIHKIDVAAVAGENSVSFDLSSAGKGLYFISLEREGAEIRISKISVQ